MRDILQDNLFVGLIVRQHKAADNFDKTLPWLVLHNTGKVRKHPTFIEAKDDAQKTWPNCKFKNRP